MSLFEKRCGHCRHCYIASEAEGNSHHCRRWPPQHMRPLYEQPSRVVEKMFIVRHDRVLRDDEGNFPPTSLMWACGEYRRHWRRWWHWRDAGPPTA